MKKHLLNLAMGSVVPDPAQPRSTFDNAELVKLATSIKDKGIIQPITVRPVDDKFVIVAGERRWRAAAIAGLTEIPALCVSVDTQTAFELSVAENTMRVDLSYLEEALAYHRFRADYALSIPTIAATVGKSTTHVSDVLKILDLHPPTQQLFAQPSMPVKSVPLLLAVPDADAQVTLGRKLLHGMSIKEAGEWLKSTIPRSTQPAPSVSSPYTPLVSAVRDAIQSALQWRVGVKFKGRRGYVYLRFDNLQELLTLARRIVRE